MRIPACRGAQNRLLTRYLLDANIISNAVKQLPSARLSEWLTNQRDDNLFVSSMTVAEIQCGILELPNGKRRHALEAWFAGSEGPQALFAGRILPFDDKAGLGAFDGRGQGLTGRAASWI